MERGKGKKARAVAAVYHRRPAMEPAEAELAELVRTRSPQAAARARRLADDQALRTPLAQALAAQLLATAPELEQVQLAHELALAAMTAHRPARRLAAETFDRLRVLQGRPQKFGTCRQPDGSLFPVDPSTTDSERAKWDVPKLADLQRGDAR